MKSANWDVKRSELLDRLDKAGPRISVIYFKLLKMETQPLIEIARTLLSEGYTQEEIGKATHIYMYHS